MRLDILASLLVVCMLLNIQETEAVKIKSKADAKFFKEIMDLFSSSESEAEQKQKAKLKAEAEAKVKAEQKAKAAAAAKVKAQADAIAREKAEGTAKVSDEKISDAWSAYIAGQ